MNYRKNMIVLWCSLPKYDFLYFASENSVLTSKSKNDRSFFKKYLTTLKNEPKIKDATEQMFGRTKEFRIRTVKEENTINAIS